MQRLPLFGPSCAFKFQEPIHCKKASFLQAIEANDEVGLAKERLPVAGH